MSFIPAAQQQPGFAIIQSSPFAIAFAKSSDLNTKEGVNDPFGSRNVAHVDPVITCKELSTKLESQKKSSGVITTPTKNRFDVLDTESELNKAFSNLQRSDIPQSLALVPILEVPVGALSDGSGTPLESCRGADWRIIWMMKETWMIHLHTNYNKLPQVLIK